MSTDPAGAQDTPGSPVAARPGSDPAPGGRRSWAPFVAAAALLVFVGVAVTISTFTFERNAHRIQASHELILRMESTMLALRSMEAAQRLHLLSGSSESLAHFHGSADDARDLLHELHALAPADPDQKRGWA